MQGFKAKLEKLHGVERMLYSMETLNPKPYGCPTCCGGEKIGDGWAPDGFVGMVGLPRLRRGFRIRKFRGYQGRRFNNTQTLDNLNCFVCYS